MDLIIPTKEPVMKVSLAALHKIAQFILENPMKPGDTFTITGTDQSRLIIKLEK